MIPARHPENVPPWDVEVRGERRRESSRKFFQFPFQVLPVDNLQKHHLGSQNPVKHPFVSDPQAIQGGFESLDLLDPVFAGGQGGGFENPQLSGNFQSLFGREFIKVPGKISGNLNDELFGQPFSPAFS